MSNEELSLEELPIIPEGMLIAASSGILVPFIGAGVSMLGGCPSWSELANRALRSFIGDSGISHGHYDQLSKLPSRVKLTLADDLQRKYKKKIDYKKILSPSEDKSKKDDADKAYASLRKLSTLIVTTNYDDWLDKPFNDSIDISENSSPNALNSLIVNVVYKREDITPLLLDATNTIVHIHGSIMDDKSMVVTTTDYLKRYSNPTDEPENQYLKFLEVLFENRSVFFVGYSLEELEILEYVFTKSNLIKENEASQPKSKHFLLQGFFSHEIEVAKNLKVYFQKFGVELIPFLKDRNSYKQLIPIIEDLAAKVPMQPVMIHQEKITMASLL
ncbi:MAG: hypothetical protein RJB18_1360 [Pseudomonadota bacterium]|jgi:hypothetical protein